MRILRPIICLLLPIFIWVTVMAVKAPSAETIDVVIADTTQTGFEEQEKIEYTPLGVPNVSSFFKSWMPKSAITAVSSPQYKLLQNEWVYIDSLGFVRALGEKDLGVQDDYYFIALGSYYGTTIGTKYRITTDTGNVFYGILGDCKADIHTNPTHQYRVTYSEYGAIYNIVEFIVDGKTLSPSISRSGSANIHMPLNGNIAKIERMNFITE